MVDRRRPMGAYRTPLTQSPPQPTGRRLTTRSKGAARWGGRCNLSPLGSADVLLGSSRAITKDMAHDPTAMASSSLDPGRAVLSFVFALALALACLLLDLAIGLTTNGVQGWILKLFFVFLIS